MLYCMHLFDYLLVHYLLNQPITRHQLNAFRLKFKLFIRMRKEGDSGHSDCDRHAGLSILETTAGIFSLNHL